MRTAAIAALQEGLASGRLLVDLSREMRLPIATAHRWLTESRAVFRPVVVEPDPPSVTRAAGLVLRTRQGHQLAGLDVAAAIAVLCALERER